MTYRAHIPEHRQLTAIHKAQLTVTVLLRFGMACSCVFLVVVALVATARPLLWRAAFVTWASLVTLYLLALGDLMRIVARMSAKVWDAFGEEACTVCQMQDALREDVLPDEPREKVVRP